MALIVVDAIIVGWRTDLVRAMPQTASFYAWLGMPVNLRGLEFDGLATTTEQHDGVPILVVGGQHRQRHRQDRDRAASCRFAVRNAAQEEMYSWTARSAARGAAAGRGRRFPHPACLAAAGVPRRTGALRQPSRHDGRNPLTAMARILIAEDEEALCAMCARALATDGHEVKTACDGSEALDMLTREEGRFDLLLTDIRMPIMDGIALSLAAARDFPDLTILLMTGYADQRERAHGLDALDPRRDRQAVHARGVARRGERGAGGQARVR